MTVDTLPAAPARRVETAARPEVRTRSAKSTFVLVTRRLHLYFGLLLLPWVLLYGVTGFLFNHPGAFSPREVRVLGAEHLAGTAFDETPDPDALAAAVVSALRAHWREETAGNGATPVFGTPRNARLSGRLFTRLEDVEPGAEGLRRHTVVVDWEGGGAKVYSSPAEEPDPVAPFAVSEGLVLAEDPYAEAPARLASALGAIEGVPVEVDETRGLPRLSFALDVDGTPWNVSYGFREGDLEARQGDEEPRPLRSFLTRLHMTHGFPVDGGPPWWWAVIVDLMALSMVGWSVTGVILWWQIKKVRAWGWISLAVSVAAAAALWAGMVAEIG